MSELLFAVCVTDRALLGKLNSVYRQRNIPLSLVTLGRGTAEPGVLDTLGIDNTEKAIAFSVTTDEIWKELRRGLRSELKIDAAGRGIAFTVPLASIGGRASYGILTRGTGYEKGEESVLKDTKTELIVAICEQGYNGDVMDCARKAGAGGGTVIHARGTGSRDAEKFLGITLASEKDMIFIVTPTEKKADIMTMIAKEAGAGTRAGAICFSLPVTDTAGIVFDSEG